jgi:hypothetical protein
MRRPSVLALGFTILLSAFLLFQVQPIISKYILPWFGGGPGVWTTCMVFFQIVLFAGYAYAHLLTRLPEKTQFTVHAVLIVGALCSLPIEPSDRWKPGGEADPITAILLLLGAKVGLPYFVLASTSPLIQVWYSRIRPGESPWRLYALSNVGSLAALLTYPFIVEPRLDVSQQTWIWSGAFVAVALLLIFLVRRDMKQSRLLPEVPLDDDASDDTERALRWYHRPLWLLLPALGSALLLAATSHVCQDVAVIPFLWVVPLSLYLISFIITFDHPRWYQPAVWALPALVILAVTAVLPHLPELIDLQSWLNDILPTAVVKHLPEAFSADLKPNYYYELAWAFGAMFFGVMLCHGELVRLRPSTKYLTQFYLIMSAGGAIGGLLVSIAAPKVFATYMEWPIVLNACFALAAIVLLRSLWSIPWAVLRAFFIIALLLPLSAAGIWIMQRFAFKEDPKVAQVRNFYGTISVEESYDSESETRSLLLYHGTITHGIQNIGPAVDDEPASYYGAHTGIGIALQTLRGKPDAKVGVLGMGTATVTSYAETGQTYRIYEINPEIVKFAHEHFTYLKDMQQRGAKLEEVVGDGRLALEKEPPQGFDVLLLDAFSGDSVPVHLLTTEALAIYERHMKPGGIIVYNITNRYLRLKQVLEKVGESQGWSSGFVSTYEDGDHYSTDYLLLTKNQPFLASLPKPWTDKYHNLFQILVTD